MNITALCSLAALENLPDASIDAMVSILPRDVSPVSQQDLGLLFNEDQRLASAGPRSPVPWRTCARVLKPGGHALVATPSGDMDVIGMALRLAKFEIRDAILVETASVHVPVLLARTQLATKSLIENIRHHGAGALNIAATRVLPTDDEVILGIAEPEGRWPTNLVHDGSPAVENAMRERRRGPSKARFFTSLVADSVADRPATALARHLLRLAVPPGGVVLDPFAATDLVGHAAASLGVRAVLVRR
ncbi:DNA methyltransferase [Falsiroseomonas oryziterrae]|uniref:DNA methyltransferase n=1 Tax=Falsiroseomonas oryziterrae TaxID=2911368 RepID=UPI001F380838|nr:DNA methyltransferase [Roseomonas sp. NPKOSM-4]